ncbi:MAG TPA: serine/threonine-protein kinase [Actinomycetota bacterium]|nr:serine/threonine-protein kinase [Actinomycetota bacterium]
MVYRETTDDRIVDERYALRKPLGRGSLGVVWEADDNVLNRRVALKEIEVPSAVGAQADGVRARVILEAIAVARLNHPGAVTTYDVFREEDRVYIVMELVEDPTLAEIVAKEGPLSPSRAAAIGAQVADVLATAHERGIVHRDVKPANLMVGEGDRVKLADFGIASVKDDSRITTRGLVLGSPSFMAPEQAQSSDSRPAADTWALGATLFYAVEGAPPFDKGSAIPTLAAAASEDPPPATRAGPLAPVISEMLTKEPGRRPLDEDLVVRLQEVADGVAGSRRSTGVFERPRPVLPEWGPVPEDEPYEGVRPPQRRARPLSRLFAAVAIVAAALAAAAFVSAALAGVWTLDDLLGGARSDRDRKAAVAENRGGRDSSPADGSDAQNPSENESSVPTGDSGGTDGTVVPQGVPASWTAYTDPKSGYTLAYPADWVVRPQSASSTTTDFADPETGTYLRVDWTDNPGPSPEAHWEQYSAAFAGSHDHYTEIRIVPTNYKGYEAALWEYGYRDGGTELHAYNLGFVTSDFGFALNFQARADNWNGSKALFERFKAAFQVPD